MKGAVAAGTPSHPRLLIDVETPLCLVADMNMAAIPAFSLEKEAVVKEVQARQEPRRIFVHFVRCMLR